MATEESQRLRSRLNRRAEAACYWGILLFAVGTVAHVCAGLGLAALAAAGVSWPYWLNLVIVPTLPVMGLAVVLFALPTFYLTERRK